MAAESQRNRLPFEPSKNRQKPAKAASKPSEPPKKSEKKPSETHKKPTKKPSESPEQSKTRRYTREEMAVPQIVSRRMVRRMAGFCGVPTALGILTLISNYIVLSHSWFKLPNVVVLLASMGFTGLGILGLTYGVLSASWDEEVEGSKLGWQEFIVNWGRMVSAWRETKQKNV